MVFEVKIKIEKIDVTLIVFCPCSKSIQCFLTTLEHITQAQQVYSKLVFIIFFVFGVGLPHVYTWHFLITQNRKSIMHDIGNRNVNSQFNVSLSFSGLIKSKANIKDDYTVKLTNKYLKYILLTWIFQLWLPLLAKEIDFLKTDFFYCGLLRLKDLLYQFSNIFSTFCWKIHLK